MSSSVEFDRALASFRSTLTAKEKAEFPVVKFSDVGREITRIETLQNKSRMQRGLRRMQPLIAGLRTFAGVVDTFVQVKPDVLGVIWGPIKFILQATHLTSHVFDSILDAFKEIGECLPRFSAFERDLREAPQLRNALAWLYRDILEFFSVILRLLRKRAWKQVFEILWRTLGPRIDSLRIRILSHRDLIDAEAAAVNIDRAQSFYAEARARFEEEDKRLALLSLQEANDWLDPPSFEDEIHQFEDILDESPAEGHWLEDNKTFKLWASFDSQKNHVLFISGIPGSGKTLLAYQIVSRILPAVAPGSVSMSVFLNDEDQMMQKRSDAVISTLKSVIFQLIQNDQETLLPVFHEFKGKASKMFGKTKKSLESLLGKLLDVTELAQIYIVLDGVDEINPDKIGVLLRYFTKLAEDYSTIRLLVSSRTVPDVKSVLVNALTIQVHDHNSGDIESYARAMQLSLDESLQLNDTLSTTLLQKIITKCDGMFLYCRLMYQTLSRQTDIASLREAANDLPKGLDEAYARVIRDILHLDDRQRQKVVQILEFLTCVKRRPRACEIKKTFNIRSNEREFDADKELRKDLDEICGPLIEVRHGIVSFVHFTAKEFIQSPECKHTIEKALEGSSTIRITSKYFQSAQDSVQSIFPIHKTRANRRMAIRILNYLNFSCFDASLDQDSILSNVKKGDYLWLRYANEYWLVHVKQALQEVSTKDSELEDALHRFVKRWMLVEPADDDRIIAVGLSLLTRMQLKSPDLKRKLALIAFHRSQNTLNASDAAAEPLALDGFLKQVCKAINKLTSNPFTGPKHADQLHEFYGTDVFFCNEESCSRCTIGFESKQERDRHVQMHKVVHKRDVDGPKNPNIGFTTLVESHSQHKTDEDMNLVTCGIQNLHTTVPRPQTDAVSVTKSAHDWLTKAFEAVHKDEVQGLHDVISNHVMVMDRFERRDPYNHIMLLAAQVGSLKILKHLIVNWGIEPDMRPWNSSKPTALAEAGSVEVAQLLMSCGADPLLPVRSHPSNPKSRLHTVFASFFSHETLKEDVIRAILDYDPTEVIFLLEVKRKTESDPRIQKSIYDTAAQYNHLEELFLLLEYHGLKVTSDTANKLLNHKSAQIPPAVLQRLEEAGADVKTTRDTQLMFAIKSRDIPRMDFLIKRGVPVTQESLEDAAKVAYVEEMRHLIHCGAEVNVRHLQKSLSGNTKRMPDAVRVLLDAGLSFNFRYLSEWQAILADSSQANFLRLSGTSFKDCLRAYGIDVGLISVSSHRYCDEEMVDKIFSKTKEDLKQQLQEANQAKKTDRSYAPPEPRPRIKNELDRQLKGGNQTVGTHLRYSQPEKTDKRDFDSTKSISDLEDTNLEVTAASQASTLDQFVVNEDSQLDTMTQYSWLTEREGTYENLLE